MRDARTKSGSIASRLSSLPSAACCSPIGPRSPSSRGEWRILAGIMMASCLCSASKRGSPRPMLMLFCPVSPHGWMARTYLFQGQVVTSLEPWIIALDRDRGRNADERSADPDDRGTERSLSSSRIVGRAGLWGYGRWWALWIILLVLPWFVAIMGEPATASCRNRSGRICSPKYSRGRKRTARRRLLFAAVLGDVLARGAACRGCGARGVAPTARAAARFLLAWLVPCWIVFELVVTKLPHYVLPLYPAIAILIARTIERRALSENPHLTRFT